MNIRHQRKVFFQRKEFLNDNKNKRKQALKNVKLLKTDFGRYCKNVLNIKIIKFFFKVNLKWFIPFFLYIKPYLKHR